MIAAAMKTRPRAHWLEAMEKAGVPCAPVNDIGELARRAQFAAVGDGAAAARASEPQVVGLPITFDRERPHSPRSAPRLGEHTAEVFGKTAMSNEAIKQNVKVCMFDQYGTVVDMQGGLAEIATPFLEKKGWKGNPNSFVTWWRRTHFENSMIDALLHREHTPYREIGHRAVAYVMDRAGISYTKDEVR